MIELLQKWAAIAPEDLRISTPLKDHNGRTFWMVYFTCFGQYFLTLSDKPMSENERAYADCLVQGAVQRALTKRRLTATTRYWAEPMCITQFVFEIEREITGTTNSVIGSGDAALKAFVKYLEGLQNA